MPRYVDLDNLQLVNIDVDTVNRTAYVDIREVQQALRQAEAQTGEVAPVVHGRWLCVDTDTEQFFLCNRCKKKEYWESNYCPKCGADMRGGNEYGDES